MNRWKTIAAMVFCGTLIVAQSGHAQDDFGGGGFGGGFDFGGGGFPGGGGNRGGGQPQQQQQQQQNQRVGTLLVQSNAAENIMTALKSALERNNAPKLSKDQEKELNTYLVREAKAALADIEAKAKEQGLTLPNQQAAAAPPLGKNAQDVVVLFIELNTGRGNNNQNRNFNNNGNRGNRGGGNNNNNNNGNNNNRLNSQILRPAEDAFLTKLADVPSLNAKQKTAVIKWRNDTIRARGGVEEFRVQMDEAGFPLTADQVTQLRTVFEESDQKRTTLRNDMLQKVTDLTTPEAQREPPTSQNQSTNQNQNQNNNPLNQLQNLGRVDDARVLALSTETRQKLEALDKETNTKILRALNEPQRPAFVQIELQRQQARQANIKQQAQQLLTRR